MPKYQVGDIIVKTSVMVQTRSDTGQVVSRDEDTSYGRIDAIKENCVYTITWDIFRTMSSTLTNYTRNTHVKSIDNSVNVRLATTAESVLYGKI